MKKIIRSKSLEEISNSLQEASYLLEGIASDIKIFASVKYPKDYAVPDCIYNLVKCGDFLSYTSSIVKGTITDIKGGNNNA